MSNAGLAQAALIGLLAGLVVILGRKALLKYQLGADAYHDLAALQPRITQPMIRAAPPSAYY